MNTNEGSSLPLELLCKKCSWKSKSCKEQQKLHEKINISATVKTWAVIQSGVDEAFLSIIGNALKPTIFDYRVLN